MKRKLLAFAAIAGLGLTACSAANNNDEIRADLDGIFLLSSTSYIKSGDWTALNFIDMESLTAVRWVGGSSSGREYLSYLNVGDCYISPLTPSLVEEVPCPKLESQEENLDA